MPRPIAVAPPTAKKPFRKSSTANNKSPNIHSCSLYIPFLINIFNSTVPSTYVFSVNNVLSLAADSNRLIPVLVIVSAFAPSIFDSLIIIIDK